jgi:hypothetical protein
MNTTDCEPEPLIRLADVPTLQWIPKRGGKPIHIATIYRWVNRGIKGRRLRTAQVGGGQATTVTWLNEFFNLAPSVRNVQTASQRQREIARAERELAEAGI